MLKHFKLCAEDSIVKYKKRLSGMKGLRKLIMCKKCFTFYYKNSWHPEVPLFLKDHQEEEINVLFSQCLPCLEDENNFYENEANIVFGGLNYQT